MSVSVSYRKRRLLTDDQTDALAQLFYDLPDSAIDENYNFQTERVVTDVIVKQILPSTVPAEYFDIWAEILYELNHIVADAGIPEDNSVHYLMQLNAGAEIAARRDRTSATLLTLVYNSIDLVGGDSEIYFHDRETPSTVDHDVGVTILYRNRSLRGLSLITRGHKIVLVSLYGAPPAIYGQTGHNQG